MVVATPSNYQRNLENPAFFYIYIQAKMLLLLIEMKWLSPSFYHQKNINNLIIYK